MTQGLKIVTSEFAVAQFAGSIGQNIMTLRDLWVQVKDARPRNEKAPPGLSRENDDVQRSLIRCKECIVEFQPLIEDLATQVQGKCSWRNRLGSTKVVLNKQRIESLKWRLNDAIVMLQLSCGLHLNTMMQLQPEIIVTKLAERLKINTQLELANSHKDPFVIEDPRWLQSRNLVATQDHYYKTPSPWSKLLLGEWEFRQWQNSGSRKSHEDTYFAYNFPNLFAYYKVSVWTRRPLSGLWFNWAIHRTISENDTFIIAIKQGNLTILAAELANPDMCRLLLNAGSDPLSMDKFFQ
ncbi:hypothetical protein V8E51_017262 [Hyaloscypha variabilis]